MRPVLTFDAAIYLALNTMRDSRNHLALVESGGELIGRLLVTAPVA